MIIERTAYINKIYNAIKFVPIVVLIGARQVGKTTLMESLKIRGSKLFLNGQNPEIINVFEEFFFSEKYLMANLNANLKGTLFLDEFQYIPEVSSKLKLLTDKYKQLKIICSGSSSLDILNNVSESLAGRVRTIPVYSLSFREYLKFNDENLSNRFEKYSIYDNIIKLEPKIKHLFKEYLIYGGLPKVALARKYEDKTELLSDIYQTYLLKDVRNYVKNGEFVGFNKLLKLLSAQIGNLMNINEISKLTHLTYKKCEEYIHILEQMYIINTLSPFLTNKRKELTKMKKLYFCDLGLRNIVYNSFNDIDIRVDNGALFENFVYLELVKEICKAENIYYYRTKDNLEIDFIMNQTGKIIPLESKFSEFKNPEKYSPFSKLANIINFEKAYLVNINNNETFDNLQYVPGFIISKLKLNQ